MKLLFIPMSEPPLLGLYDENNSLKVSLELQGQTSTELPKILKNILDSYEIKELIYANGPGSFMSLKIAYLIFSSISIALNIPLKAVSGFEFSKQRAIRANKTMFFVFENNQICIKKLDLQQLEFLLPNYLELEYEKDNTPNYVISAV